MRGLLAGVAIVVIVVGGSFLLFRRYVRRYEAEQRRRGLWDENGPIHPTRAPRWYGMTRTSLPLNLGDGDPEPGEDPDAFWTSGGKRK